MSTVLRVGETVERTAGPWTPTVHRLLAHLPTRGIDWAPRPLGRTTDGREVLTFVPGQVPHYPLPDYVWDDANLTEAARRLADLHDATSTFDRTDAIWQLPGREPAEVVCHNDFAPYNLAFTAGRVTGAIDFDTCSPGPRIWDVAYLAYRMVPLTHPGNTDAPVTSIAERRRRIALACRAYGPGPAPSALLPVVIDRLLDLAEFTERRASAGATHIGGHGALYRRDAAWVRDHTVELLQGQPPSVGD